MSNARRALFGILLGAGATVLPASSRADDQGAEHLLNETPEIALRAFEPNGQICGETMRFTLRAAVPEAFLYNATKIEGLMVGGIRAAKANCTVMTRIVLTGYVGDDLYFAGVATADDGWRLTWLAAAPSH